MFYPYRENADLFYIYPGHPKGRMQLWPCVQALQSASVKPIASDIRELWKRNHRKPVTHWYLVVKYWRETGIDVYSIFRRGCSAAWRLWPEAWGLRFDKAKAASSQGFQAISGSPASITHTKPDFFNKGSARLVSFKLATSTNSKENQTVVILEFLPLDTEKCQ